MNKNSEKIKVAVLGVGHIGEVHVKAVKASPYVSEIIGYEPEEQRALERQRVLDIKVYSELNTVLNDPEVRLVIIASPNDYHAELTRLVLEAGKAVLCEKPMGVTIDEAKEIVEISEKYKHSFLQIGFECRYSKMYMLAKQWIDEGKIGEVVKVQTSYLCSEFHKKGTWRSLSPGSLISEKLSHYLDLQRWFVGKEVSEVYSVAAPNVVSYFNHPDNHHIVLKFTNGAVGSLNFVMYIGENEGVDPLLGDKETDAGGQELKFLILGKKGAIETDVFNRRIRRFAFTEDEERLRSKIVEEITYPFSEAKEWYHNIHGQTLHIAELVATNKPCEIKPQDSLESMKLCFAAEKSEEKNRVVKLSEFS